MDDDLQDILKSLDIDCDEPLPIAQASSAFEENTLLALAKVRQILVQTSAPVAAVTFPQCPAELPLARKWR